MSLPSIRGDRRFSIRMEFRSKVATLVVAAKTVLAGPSESPSVRADLCNDGIGPFHIAWLALPGISGDYLAPVEPELLRMP